MIATTLVARPALARAPFHFLVGGNSAHLRFGIWENEPIALLDRQFEVSR
jgi:hypothetical protein